MNRSHPIYYNLSQIVGFKSTIQSSPVPAFIEELNNQVIIDSQKEYYISIAMTTIPTSDIPLWIAPIVSGIDEEDINKLINNFTFTYNAPDGSVLLQKNQHVQFQSQILNPSEVGQNSFSYPKTPKKNNGAQDTSTRYYWVYDIELILKMFNESLTNLWIDFISDVNSIYDTDFSTQYNPNIVFDYSTRSFKIIFVGKIVINSIPTNYFEQIDGLSTFSLLIDEYTSDLLQLSGQILGYDNTNIKLLCFNKGDNLIVTPNEFNPLISEYKLTMTASQSSLTNYSAFTKIVFSVVYGISTVQEYDSIPIPTSEGTNSTLLNKPQYQMLTDLEVNKDEFALNRNFIQFTSSNITQTRLITLTGSMLQSFSIAVYWIDNFGNRQQLYLPSGTPLTIKLAFYPKTTTLI